MSTASPQDQLREKVRNHILSLLPKSKKKVVNVPQEIILHQKALQLQSIGHDYEKTYVDIWLEILTMMETKNKTLSDALEDVISNKIGWNSVLFEEWVEKERRDIINLTRPLEVEEGIYTCPKCKSKKTHHYSRQMRSADEPATTIVTCANQMCQFNWKIN
jgi:DNA-directed RNA polymerase subunit M/transcription elongation factor TFIIS